MKQYDIGIDLGTTSIIIATEEQGVVFCIGPEIRAAVVEVMQRRMADRMVGRADPGQGGDIGEFADACGPDLAITHDVGIVADGGFVDMATLRHLGVMAEAGGV